MASNGRQPDDQTRPHPEPHLARQRALLAASTAAPRRRRRRFRLRPGLLLPAAALAGGVAVLALLAVGRGGEPRGPADLRDELIPLGVEAPAASAPSAVRPKRLRDPERGGSTQTRKERGRRAESAGPARTADPAREALKTSRVPSPSLALTAPAGTAPEAAAAGRDSTPAVAASGTEARPEPQPARRDRS